LSAKLHIYSAFTKKIRVFDNVFCAFLIIGISSIYGDRSFA